MSMGFFRVLVLLGCLTLGYLLGSIPNSVIICKVFYHVDPRELGSHNPGGTNGGRVVSNVTPLVNYVVSNETESSNKKFVTAKKLGIRIINEEEFKHLLEGTF